MNAIDCCGKTVLHHAAEEGHIKQVKRLVELGANIDFAQSKSKMTPLHDAAIRSQTKMIDALIKLGANIDATNVNGYTPLHYSASASDTTAVRLLIKAKANIEYKNYEGYTALHAAANCWLHDNRGSATVAELIKAGADINATTKGDNTPLHIAAKSNVSDASAVIHQLKKAGADIEAKNDQGCTPLHLAVQWGATKNIEVLLNEGAKLEECDRQNQTPLFIAAVTGRTDTVKTLLKCGANLSSIVGNDPPFLERVSSFGLDTVVYLLSLPDFQPITRFGAQLAAGNNALLLRAVIMNRLDVVNQLLACDEVVDNITTNDNAIIRSAISNRRAPIEARLRQVPVLRNYRYRPIASNAPAENDQPLAANCFA